MGKSCKSGNGNNMKQDSRRSKYYDMAINGFSNLMRLNCPGYEDQPNPQIVGRGELAALVTSPRHQTDCRTFFDDGSITDANRYSIREWNHNAKDMKFDHNSTLYSITLYKS